jgi:hypothetical protein
MGYFIMQIKIKKLNADGIVRLESSGDIKEVIIKEDFMSPDMEVVSICFKGKNSSGIIDLKTEEIEKIYESVKSKKRLIKGFKIFAEKKD